MTHELHEHLKRTGEQYFRQGAPARVVEHDDSDDSFNSAANNPRFATREQIWEEMEGRRRNEDPVPDAVEFDPSLGGEEEYDPSKDGDCF